MADTLTYRFSTPEEVQQVGRLVAHSFPGTQRTPHWWYEQLRDPIYGGGPETLLVGHLEGRLTAACQVHPLRQWVGGALLPVAGVGSVAISPAQRKRRLGAELIAAALRAARERGDVASALYPFRTGFYQRLGYGIAGEAIQHVLPPGVIPDSDERRRVELLDGDGERAEALELYSRWARTQTGQLERPGRLWESLTTAHDRAVVGYRGAAGSLEGYSLVTYRADGPSHERFLDVDELVWETVEARRGLHGWLASLGDQWRRLVVRTLPSHRFTDWVEEPRLPSGSAEPWGLWAPAAVVMMGPMFRILDLERAWSARTIAVAPPLSVALEVQDAQIPENAGSWRVEFDRGPVAVGRGAGSEPSLTLRLDVSTLSRLYVGSISATQAVEIGLASCDRGDRLPQLDAVLRLPEPWTFDRF